MYTIWRRFAVSRLHDISTDRRLSGELRVGRTVTEKLSP
jgi:hypothetical protein